MTVDFGEVRSLVYGARTADQWAALCALCEAAGPREWAEQLGPFVLEAVSAWPRALRTMPADWLDRLLAGESGPAAVAMVRELEVVAALYTIREDLDVRALERAPLGRIERLTLFAQREDCGERTDVWPLLERGQLGGLRALEVNGELTTHGSLTRLAKLPYMAKLEVFGLEGSGLDAARAATLAALPARGLILKRFTALDGLQPDAPLTARLDGLMLRKEDGPSGLPGEGAGRGLKALWLEDVRHPMIVERLMGGQLEAFGLVRSPAPAGLADALCDRPLRALAVQGVEGEGALVEALCARGALAGVERLSLGQEGADALARALGAGMRLDRLRWLQLTEQGCSVEAVAALAGAPLPALGAVELMVSRGAAEAAGHMARSSWIGQLGALHLVCAGYEASGPARATLLEAAPGLEHGLHIEAIWSFRGRAKPLPWDVFGRS